MFDKEYSFTGKHAKYVKDLTDDAELFARNIDVYILASVIGYLNSRKGEKDSGDPTTKIFGDQLRREQLNLKFNYRLIMMLADSETLSVEERVDRAFRDDGNKEAVEKNMEIYDAYVLGGVEYLHEKLYEESLDKEDYINNLDLFITDFYEDLQTRLKDEDIFEIIRKYE